MAWIRVKSLCWEVVVDVAESVGATRLQKVLEASFGRSDLIFWGSYFLEPVKAFVSRTQ